MKVVFFAVHLFSFTKLFCVVSCFENIPVLFYTKLPTHNTYLKVYVCATQFTDSTAHSFPNFLLTRSHQVRTDEVCFSTAPAPFMIHHFLDDQIVYPAIPSMKASLPSQYYRYHGIYLLLLKRKYCMNMANACPALVMAAPPKSKIHYKAFCMFA